MHTSSRWSPTRRSLGVLASIALLAIVTVIGAQSTSATPAFAFSRYAGNDRYDTARKIALDTFGSSADVVIASGETYADALSGSYAAGLINLPVLLTARDSVPDATDAGLAQLGVTKARIIGGTASVSASVESTLQARGITTTRTAGATRYETAKKVAETGGGSAVGKTGTDPTAVLVSGEAFPDALSAGPVGYASHFPITLTTPGMLSPDAKAALVDLAIKHVLIVGGTSAVSMAVQTEVTGLGITVQRIAGNDRTETAAAVADYELASLGFISTHVDLARGDDFADALAGASHSGKRKSPALLTVNPTTLGAATKAWLSAHAGTLTDGHIDGGANAVSASVESEANSAARTT